MTDPTPQRGADTGLPVPAMSDLQMRAWRLHYLIDALDMINDSAPISFPDDSSEEERRAISLVVPMVEMLREYSGVLAAELDAFAAAQRKVTA